MSFAKEEITFSLEGLARFEQVHMYNKYFVKVKVMLQ
jgi:hypothetical protein